MNNSSRHIIVCGAGLGGLTAALALLRKGFRVTVLEQAPALGEVGAGLQLSANATGALYRLGVGDALQSVASVPSDKQIRLWNTGEAWKLFDLGSESLERYGYPYFTLYRADLHRVLVDAVVASAPDSIRLNARCIAIEQSDDGVRVGLADGSWVSGDVVIGADGVHSRVRAALFNDDNPKFSGCLAWRGVIPAQDLPEHLREPVGNNWIGPGAHVIHYPLRRGELVNFVGIVERDDWQVESWTEAGETEECLRDFAGWHADVQTMIKAIATPFKWALMVREPMTSWTAGKAALLGDACHPTLPFLAQGAAMAIEDGYMVARALDSYHDPEEALRRYESARLARTTRIVRGSAENAKRFHNPALATREGAMAYIDEQFSEPLVRARYEWLFEYNVDAAPL